MKKSTNQTHHFIFYPRISHSWLFGQVDKTCRMASEPLPYTLRKYSRIITYPIRIGQTLQINLPYLTYTFTMFTHHLYIVSRMNYTIFMSIHTLYDQNHRTIRIGRMTIRSRRIHYVSYELHYVPSVQNVLLGTLNNPRNCHSLIKFAEL